MALVIDANMIHFAERMNISSSRMVNDYGLATVDEIIEAEAERGNNAAVKYASSYYDSPDKLIKIFKLTDVGNKFAIIKKMDNRTRERLLPLLDQKDLVMGLHFFTQEKLLAMLMDVNIIELVRVAIEAFPLAQLISMIPEEDLAKFMQHKDLDKRFVMEEIERMPPEMFQKFIESTTGMPFQEVNVSEFIMDLRALPDDKFKKFMSQIDPDVQRQLSYQLAKEHPDVLTLFENKTYVNMLNTMLKPEMIKPMIMLNHETLVKMTTELPKELMAVVASQIDPVDFAIYLQDGHMDLIEDAWMI